MKKEDLTNFKKYYLNEFEYYNCLSKRKHRAKCNKKPIRKQLLEDIVIDTTAKLLANTESIHTIAQNIYSLHRKQTSNTALKLLKKRHKII